MKNISLLLILSFLFFFQKNLIADNTCATATPLSNSMSSFDVYSNVGNTSSGTATPSCGNYVTADIWFSTTISTNGEIDIVTLAGGMTNGAMAVYTGSCSNLTELVCTQDDLCTNTMMPALQLDNLTPGSTIYIRIWAENGVPNGTFEIRITSGDPPLTPLPFNSIAGTATNGGGGCTQLTSAVPNQLGCTWDSNPRDFSMSFEEILELNFGSNDGGADGIVIGFQQNLTAGSWPHGVSGGAIGTNGLPNSFFIEFDTWANGQFADIPQDHVAVFTNGNMATPISGPTALNGGNIEDGQNHVVRFKWTAPTMFYEVFFDDLLVASGTYDIINNSFGGSSTAYFGATSTTGAATNVQSVCPYQPEIFPTGNLVIVDQTICEGQSFFAGGANQTMTGTYFDQTPLANGCFTQTQTNLTVIPSSTSSISDVICFPNSVTVGTSSYSSTGIHVTTLPNANWQMCDSIVTLDLTVLNPQAVVFPPLEIISCTNQTVTLDGSTLSTAGPGVVYSWTGPTSGCFVSGETTATPVVNCPGLYTLTVIQTVGNVSCPVVAAPVNVGINITPPTADAGAAQILDCVTGCTTLDGSNSSSGLSIIYTWSGPNGFTSTDQNPVVCETGQYTLTVLDLTNGCLSVPSMVTVSGSAPPTADAGADQTINCNNPTTTLDGSNSTTGAGYTLSWQNTSGVQLGMGTTYIATMPGTYILVVTDGSGCSSTDEVIVSGNTTLPNADAGMDMTIDCNSTSTILDGSNSDFGSGFTLTWENSSGVQVGTGTMYTATISGTYTLIVTNTATGCSSTDEAIVTGNSNLPNADAGMDMPIDCNNASTILDGSNSDTGTGFTLTWENSSGVQVGTGTTYLATMPGTYTLIVTNTATGCSSTDEAIVLDNTTLPNADAGMDMAINCNNTSTILDGSNSDTGTGFTLIWENSSGVQVGTGTMYTATMSGIYTLIVTNTATGCVSTDDVEVTGNTTLPIANAGNDVTLSCGTMSSILDGSGSDTGTGFTLTWQNSSGMQVGTGTTLTVTTQGTYTLIVTNNATGCSSTDDAMVMVDNNVPTSDPGINQTINCNINQVTLNGSNSTSGTGIIYEWLNPLGISVGNDVLLNNVIVSGTYTLAVTDTNNGCSHSETVDVIQDIVNPVADAGQGGLLSCTASSIQLDGSNSSMGSNFEYNWLNSNNTNVGSGIMINVSASGTYYLEVTDMNNGCTQIDSVTITQDSNVPLATASSNGNITCINSSVLLDGNGSSVGTAVDYQWLDAQNMILGTDLTLSVVDSGTYTLVVTDMANGCSSSTDVLVTENMDLPNADAGMNAQLTCNNNQVTLDGSNSSMGGNFIYEWFSSNNMPAGTGVFINVSQIDTYTLIVTNQDNGCTNSATVDVTQDANVPSVNIISNTNTLSCDDVNILLDGTGSSSGISILYTWTDGINMLGNNPTLTISTPGNYILTVVDTSNGCDISEMVAIDIDTISPIINYTSGTITCSNTTVTLDGTGSSSGTEFSFSWENINGTISNNISTDVTNAGNYQFTVTNEMNGCTASEIVVVNENTNSPTSNAGLPDNLTCGTPTLTLDGSNSTMGTDIIYEWQNSLGISIGNSITQTIGSPDIYTLIVTDTINGCTDISTVEITQDGNLPTAIITGPTDFNCFNPIVVLDGSTSTGVGMLSYEWFDALGNSLGVNSNNTITDSGTYTLVVMDLSNGCSSQVEYFVDDNSTPPLADAGMNATLTCNQSSVPLDGSNSESGPNIIYTWEDPNGINVGSTPMINATESGTYTLTVLNFLTGCSSDATVEVLQDANLPTAVILPPDHITCIQPDIILNGANSTGIGALEYTWLNNMGQVMGFNPTLNVSQPGIYILEITDLSNGCQTNATTMVNSNIDPPIADAGMDGTITCAQDMYTMSAIGSSQGSGYQYTWQDATGATVGTGLTFTTSQIGTYNLIVSNSANGCTSQDVIEVLENVTPPNAAALASGMLNCVVNDVLISASTSTGIGTLSFEWFDPSGNALGSDETILVSAAGTYEVIVTDAVNGCTDNETILVTEETTPPMPTIDALTNLNLSCSQNSLVVDGSGSIPVGLVTYQWTLNGSPISTIPNPQIDEPGTLTLLVTDISNGCTAETSVIITQSNDVPSITIANPIELTCDVTSTQLDATGTTSGLGIIYLWTGPGTIQNETSLMPTISQQGTYNLLVTDMNSGCTESSNITVTENTTPPDAVATAIDELDCNTLVVSLDGTGSSTGNVNYLWTTSNGTIVSGENTLTPQVSQQGNYILTVTNLDNGCDATANATVQISSDAVGGAEIEIVDPICVGDFGSISIPNVFGGTPPYLFSIESQPLSATDTFDFLSGGSYTILIEDAMGCQYSEEASIAFPTNVQVTLPLDDRITIGESYLLQPQLSLPLSMIDSIEWSPVDSLSCTDCLTPTASPTESQFYTITVTTIDGCKSTASMWIYVDKPRNVFIPNAFSPEGNGLNDVFYIFADDAMVKKVNTFRIFSRWGEQVFEANNFSPNIAAHGWDGFFNGKKLNPGVFVYFAEIEFIDGVVIQYKGDVTLQ